ncbi:YsnF/AvaK domain-containing protein [Cohnella sp. 56]|uniref:YsnF/AvaK domain-containing protein n=1 Tax=Cohnella sp. 56 TaxID=3113722 RepID=UPI0030E8B89E
MIGLGIPKEEAERYNEYVNDHKLLVIVDAGAARKGRVYDIFHRFGSLNADTYANLEGERRDDPVRAADGAAIGKDETIRIPVSEERVEVTKRPVVTEEISIGKRVVQDKKQVSETVSKEKAELERSCNPVVENEGLFSTSNTRREAA